LLEADPEAMVADKVMPTLPFSIMNVMDSMRGTQEMIVQGESSVNEAATGSIIARPIHALMFPRQRHGPLTKNNFKGGGQECPPHRDSLSSSAPDRR
jgi:hypothetical protein